LQACFELLEPQQAGSEIGAVVERADVVGGESLPNPGNRLAIETVVAQEEVAPGALGVGLRNWRRSRHWVAQSIHQVTWRGEALTCGYCCGVSNDSAARAALVAIGGRIDRLFRKLTLANFVALPAVSA